jgi:hypothetical protein
MSARAIKLDPALRPNCADELLTIFVFARYGPRKILSRKVERVRFKAARASTRFYGLDCVLRRVSTAVLKSAVWA